MTVETISHIENPKSTYTVKVSLDLTDPLLKSKEFKDLLDALDVLYKKAKEVTH